MCERLLELAQKGNSLQRVNSKNSLNVDKTLSTIISHSKSTSDSPIPKQRSKDSLNSDHSGRSGHVPLSETRHRFRSISMEDLPNEEFKGVLDEADSNSQDSGSMDKLSRDLDVDDDDDDDDDNSIVFGQSATDLRALTDDKDPRRLVRQMQHKDSGLSSTSEQSGRSEQSTWSIDAMSTSAFSEKSVKLVAEAIADEDVPDTVRDNAEMLEVVSPYFIELGYSHF